MDRKPAVADSFYPSSPKRLRQMIETFMDQAEPGKAGKDSILSCVAPHAGYFYSGSVAAYTYNAIKGMKALRNIDTFVVIGPNHTGRGYPVSISDVDSWITPFAKVANDKELAEAIARLGKMAIDEEAHMPEHSVEVQLPFLQCAVERPRCVFICMGDQSYESAVALESAISEAETMLKRQILVVASSDFNHYESSEVAERKDMPAINALEKLDVPEFYRIIEKSDDSACGYGPISVAALYAKGHGAKKGKLLRYATSGLVTGDYKSVVAYASILFG